MVFVYVFVVALYVEFTQLHTVSFHPNDRNRNVELAVMASAVTLKLGASFRTCTPYPWYTPRANALVSVKLASLASATDPSCVMTYTNSSSVDAGATGVSVSVGKPLIRVVLSSPGCVPPATPRKDTHARTHTRSAGTRARDALFGFRVACVLLTRCVCLELVRLTHRSLRRDSTSFNNARRFPERWCDSSIREIDAPSSYLTMARALPKGTDPVFQNRSRLVSRRARKETRRDRGRRASGCTNRVPCGGSCRDFPLWSLLSIFGHFAKNGRGTARRPMNSISENVYVDQTSRFDQRFGKLAG